MRTKAVHQNKTEGLDRRRQRAEMSLSGSMSDGDFEDQQAEDQKRNPLFFAGQEKLKQARGRDKKEYFLLTLQEAYYDNDDTDSEDERSKKLKEANVVVKSLYSKADESNDSRLEKFEDDGGFKKDEDCRQDSQLSFAEDDTHRQILPPPENDFDELEQPADIKPKAQEPKEEDLEADD